MAVPSFLDLAEEAQAALGSKDIGGCYKAVVSSLIKALTVLMAKSQGFSKAPFGFTW